MPLDEAFDSLLDDDAGSTPAGSVADEFEIVDHYQSALNRLIQEYKFLPNFAAFLKATTTNADELEATFQTILIDRALGNATGAQLDVLGEIVGVARNGLVDADYTTLIRCQIKANLSSGTIEDLIAVVFPILGTSDYVKVTESQPAALILTLGLATTLDRATLIASLIAQARAAGVYGQVVFSEEPPNLTFTLDSGPGLDVGHLAGSVIA